MHWRPRVVVPIKADPGGWAKWSKGASVWSDSTAVSWTTSSTMRRMSMSQTGILLGNRAIDWYHQVCWCFWWTEQSWVRWILGLDEDSNADKGSMRMLCRRRFLSDEPGLMEYVPKKTSARKSSAVHMSSARVCSVNLCGLTKIEWILCRHCIITSQYMIGMPKTVGILEYTGHNCVYLLRWPRSLIKLSEITY